jgi:hypothetical protein
MNTSICNYSLQTIENYKPILINSLNEILDKYIVLICEYLRYIVENIKMKNTNHFKFILMRGLETITHVFNNVLFFSRNLEMTYYHSQKAFYYYVEFIGQINEEQNVFLQLSSRDATMCVYKKTLFEIPTDYKNIFAQVNEDYFYKFDGMHLHCQIYKNVLNYILNDKCAQEEGVMEFFIYRLEILCNKLNSVILSNEESKVIDFFICSLNTKIIDTEKYFEVLDLFAKRVCKTKFILCEKKIKNKILNDDFDSNLKQSSEKFITWVFL